MDLIVGSTGLLGSAIAHRLLQRERRVRALVRSSSPADRVDDLEQRGAQLAYGDLKMPGTLAKACVGVDTVISTASSTNSRAEGDSIETVDGAGQLALIDAAREAGVGRFVFVSFPVSTLEFSLQTAKRAAEQRVIASGMTYTILQPPHFLEVWFNQALGFDWKQRTARLFGGGEAKVSFISFEDVASATVRALDAPTAANRTLRVGGPEALSQCDVVRIFESVTRAKFELQHVETAALEAQYAQPDDPVARTFAALMLLCGVRDEYAIPPGTEWVQGPLKTARQFAEQVVQSAGRV
jgi:NADH dehydrogenase